MYHPGRISSERLAVGSGLLRAIQHGERRQDEGEPGDVVGGRQLGGINSIDKHWFDNGGIYQY